MFPERTPPPMSQKVDAYTPAPWTVRTRASIDYEGNIEIAEACEGEHEANARLIAAAPELLDALKDVLERFKNERDIQLGNGYPEDYVSITAAEAAIAKAEGGDPPVGSPR